MGFRYSDGDDGAGNRALSHIVRLALLAAALRRYWPVLLLPLALWVLL